MINLPKLIAAVVVAGLAFPTFAAPHHGGPVPHKAKAKPGIAKMAPTRPDQRPLTRIQTPVNINTATAQMLEGIKGIGPKRAKAIIAYRDQNGKFATAQDLAKVNGIGPKRMKALEKSLTVG